MAVQEPQTQQGVGDTGAAQPREIFAFHIGPLTAQLTMQPIPGGTRLVGRAEASGSQLAGSLELTELEDIAAMRAARAATPSLGAVVMELFEGQGGMDAVLGVIQALSRAWKQAPYVAAERARQAKAGQPGVGKPTA